MRNTTIVVLIVFITLFIILSRPTLAEGLPEAQTLTLEHGRLLDSFAFRNGNGVTVYYQEQDGVSYIGFVYDDQTEVSQWIIQALPVNQQPDMAIVDVCGQWVRVTLNWQTGYTSQNAPIYLINWQLPVESGLCATRKVFFPEVVQ